MYKFRIDGWLVRVNRIKETGDIDFFGSQNFRYFSGTFYSQTLKFSFDDLTKITDRQKELLKIKIIKYFDLKTV